MTKSTKKIKAEIEIEKLTLENLKIFHEKVKNSSNYGKELELIENIFSNDEFKKTNDINKIALKVCLVDTTNSTNLNRYKSKLSVCDIAKHIQNIKDFDTRVENGDLTLVKEIANTGKINLFSFATKYCCYHNTLAYNHDNYFIYDSLIKDYFPMYNHNITSNQLDNFRKQMRYEEYHQCLDNFLDSHGIKSNISERRRMFDHFIWYQFREKKKETNND